MYAIRSYYENKENIFTQQPPSKVVFQTEPQPRNTNPIEMDIEDVEEHVEESLSLADKEIELIMRSLKKHGGKRKIAAQELGISERTVITSYSIHYTKLYEWMLVLLITGCIAVEFLQPILTHGLRQSDYKDLEANGIGFLIGSLPLLLFPSGLRKERGKKTEKIYQ